MNKASKIILIVLVVGLLFSLPVVSVKVVPEVTLKVLDASKNPMADVTVFQDWRHWTFESSEHREEKASDADGYVTFAEKGIKVSAFSLLLQKLKETTGVFDIHAGSGPSSIFGTKNYVSNGYWCYENCLEDGPKEIIVKEKLN